jgi:hypothetical protein
MVVALACWLIWPGPIGKMPMSQDHTIHLARAWMFAEELSSGHISGWSSYWYFGFPIGELYPVLGDLAVTLLRALSFGLLPWPTCYALVFSAGFVMMGLSLLRVARAVGLGPLPGLFAALIFYLDPGVLREGGWSYTVHYGVWMQPVACAFIWWALAEISIDLQHDAWRPRRLVLPSALVAMAMLAHPIALPMVALGAVALVLVVGLRNRMPRVLLSTGIVVVLGAALAAWWVLPLMANRAWMANFGTLYSDLGTMVGRVARSGSWAKHMAPAVGYTIVAGLLWAIVGGSRFARFLALLSVALWMMSTSDFFFRFRLDWLSESFRYLQYQRFIICAKPGLFIAAGCVPVVLGRFALARWRAFGRTPKNLAVVGFAALATIGVGSAVIVGAVAQAKANGVGSYRTQRLKGDKRFEKDYASFNEWARAKWEKSGEYFRFAYKARRHSHVYADAPAFNHAPAYKLGYTPGEVFVHRPESEQAAVLDRLRVRYVVGVNGGRGAKQVKRFGKLKVFERKVTEEVARLVGGGELEVLEDDADHERVGVRLSGVEEGARLEFNIAGYPRWRLYHDGEEVEWYEAPAVGKGEFATQAARRAGEFRTGKGNSTPPTDPMLLSVDAQDGVYELRWRHWLPADILGVTAAGLAAFLCGLMLARPRLVTRWLERVESLLRPRVLTALAALVVLAVVLRYAMGFRSESHLASGWLRVGKADDVVGMSNGPLKVDRLIGPAVLVDAEADEPATMVLEGIHPIDGTITGWFAVDDHEIKSARGDFEFVVEGRASDSEDWVELLSAPVRARGGKQKLDVPLRKLETPEEIELRITVQGRRGHTPRLGFDLELG